MKISRYNVILLLNQKRKNQRNQKMKQCKLCGTPLGKEPTTDELDKHWKKHHNWHWESNKEKTPEKALLKKID